MIVGVRVLWGCIGSRHALLGLVVVHVAGVLFTSLRQRENLIAAMVTIIKRAPSEDDIVREASGRVSRAAIA